MNEECVDKLLYSDETEKIISAFYKVYNTLGYGFLEKVYENALVIELIQLGFSVEQQYPIKVRYNCEIVGEYFADLVINHCIILEIKTADALCKDNEYQLINYLKATGIKVGLLLNFGKKAEFKRKIFTIKESSQIKL